MKITYLMPVTLFILLAVFFLGLPRLSTCELPGRAGCAKRLDRIDAGIMALISLLYAAIAFTGLGNTESPQTFAAMENASAVVELPGDECPSRIMLFSGVGEGSYSFEFSQDGVLWEAAGEYKQDYVSVLKWNELYPSATCVPRYVKISGTGPVYLGEAAFIDGDGKLIPAIGAGAATARSPIRARMAGKWTLNPSPRNRHCSSLGRRTMNSASGSASSGSMRSGSSPAAKRKAAQ